MKVRKSCDLIHWYRCPSSSPWKKQCEQSNTGVKQAVKIPGDTIPAKTGASNRKEGVNDTQQCHAIPCIPKSRLSRTPELHTHLLRSWKHQPAQHELHKRTCGSSNRSHSKPWYVQKTNYRHPNNYRNSGKSLLYFFITVKSILGSKWGSRQNIKWKRNPSPSGKKKGLH